MTKYELYQILDENGFEPSEENLETLIEGLDNGRFIITEDNMLYESNGFVRGLSDVASLGVTKLIRNAKAKSDGKAIARAAIKPTDAKVQKRAEKAEKRINARVEKHGNSDYAVTASNAFKTHAEKAATGLAAQRSIKDNAAALKQDVETTKKHTGDASKSTIVNYKEDYELYKILDNNGFEPTNENLEILKESIDNDEVLFLNASNLVLTEDIDEVSIYTQLLESNGFKVNENNIRVLSEAIENGHVLLTEAKKKTTEEKAEEKLEKKATKPESDKVNGERVLTDKGKKILKTAAIIAGTTALGAAAGGAVGFGAGALNAEQAAKKANDAVAQGTKNVEAAKAELDAVKAKGDAASSADLVHAQDKVKAAENTLGNSDKAGSLKYKARIENAGHTKNLTKAMHATVGTIAGGTAGAVYGTHKAKKATEKEEEKK